MLYTEYLALEEVSPTRHEYRDGVIIAIPDSTPDHAALAAAVLSLIGIQLPSGCRAFTSNLRVRVPATGLTTYPDGTVVCGGTQRATDDPTAVTNPTVLVEVTSNSSEDYDRGLKLTHYQAIASVQEILIVSHREPRLTLYRRDEHGWSSFEAASRQSLKLESVGAALSVDDLYRDGLEDAEV